MRTKSHSASCLLLIMNACAGYGCAGAASASKETLKDQALAETPVITPAPEAGSAEPVLDEAAWRATWRHLPLPSVSSTQAEIVSTPSGWLVVSSRDTTPPTGVGGKPLPPTMESFVYRSRDGTHWTRLPLPEGVQLSRASAAYGAGHYVITGEAGGRSVVLDSVDGENWREQIMDGPMYGRVAYVRDRFFALGYSLWTSLDGESWTRHGFSYLFGEPPVDIYAQSERPPSSPLWEIAFGNGQYLGVGTATLLSPDGVDWQFAPIDCATPDECELLRQRRAGLPEGTILELIRSSVFFAEGRFYVGQLGSADGHNWDVLPTPYPNRFAAGHLMTLDTNTNGLSVWLPGNDAPRPIDSVEADYPHGFPADQTPPDSWDLSWNDGLDCTTSRCLILSAQRYSRLYLVP